MFAILSTMSHERAPRLSFGQRLGVAGGFLLLSAGGAAAVGIGLQDALHASSKRVHTEGAELAHYKHEQADAGWVALGGAGVFLASAGAAGYFARGTYDRIMRVQGQWAWEVPVGPPVPVVEVAAAEIPGPAALPQIAVIERAA
jgi:hypothetical protein